MAKTIQKLVVVITGVETKETLERWVFDVECEKTTTEGYIISFPCPRSLPPDTSLSHVSLWGISLTPCAVCV